MRYKQPKEIEKDDILLELSQVPFTKGLSYLVYGDSESGKTQLCLWLTSQLAKNTKVAYIDTEHKAKQRIMENFSAEDNIAYAAPMSLGDFRGQINSLEDDVKEENIGAVIVDSIVYPYQDIDVPKKRSSEMKAEIKKIRDLTVKHNLVSVITSHIYEDYGAMGGKKVVPIGGKGVLHNTDYHLYIKKAKGVKRVVRLDAREKEFIIKIDKDNFIRVVGDGA